MSWIWLFIVIDVHRKRSRSVVYQVGFIAWSLIPLFALIPIVQRIDLVDEIQVYQQVLEPYSPPGYETMGDAKDVYRQEASLQTDATQITLFSINTFVFLAILVSNAIAIRKLRKVRSAVGGSTAGGDSSFRSKNSRGSTTSESSLSSRRGYAATVTPFIRIMTYQVAAFFIYDVGLFCNIFSLEMRDARYGAQHAVGIVMATTMQQTMALFLSILQMIVVSRAKSGGETKHARGSQLHSCFDLRLSSQETYEGTPGGGSCSAAGTDNESTSTSKPAVRAARGAGASKPSSTSDDNSTGERSEAARVGCAVAFGVATPASSSQV